MSNVQNVSRAIHLNQKHTRRYNMDKDRFMGGGSIGKPVVPIYKQNHLLQPDWEHIQRGSDDRHIELENRRQQQFKANSVRLIHDRPLQ
jgi:hypothetical protein